MNTRTLKKSFRDFKHLDFDELNNDICYCREKLHKDGFCPKVRRTEKGMDLFKKLKSKYKLTRSFIEHLKQAAKDSKNIP